MNGMRFRTALERKPIFEDTKIRMMNRTTRRLKGESLEARQLMANDITASYNAGTLSIRGTEGNDIVTVLFDQRVQATRVLVGTRDIVPRISSPVSNVDVKLGGGTDKFVLGAMNLNRLSIDMGTGSSTTGHRENVFLPNVTVRGMNIRSASANGVNVVVSGGSVSNQVTANFNAGNNSLRFQSGAAVDKLFARFGAGDDLLSVSGGSGSTQGRQYYNQINRADVNIGAGRDQLSVAANSNILAGSVDGGGSSNDRADIGHNNQIATLRFRTIVRR